MKNNTRKILLALLLVFTMLMSLTAVSAFAEEAEDDGKITVYFQNNWLWTEVSCHYFGSATEADTTWPGAAMTQVGTQEEYQVYALDIPADVTGIVFTGVKNDGSGALDQSPDIKEGIVDGAGWKMTWKDKNAVESFVYNPSAAPVETTYVLVGSAGLTGAEWDLANTDNELTLGDDGIYSITVTGVAAGEHKFKIARNHSWANAWPSSDYVLTLTEASDVTITFNPETNAVNVTHVAVGETPVLPDDGGETPVDPDDGETPVVSTGDFYLVGWINGADYGIKADSANVGIYKFVDGSLTVNITSDSYVLVKSGDNANWYWSDAYCTDTSVTLNKHDASHEGEKMLVPAGQITFTLTENENGSLTLSYNKGAGGGSTEPAEPAENPIEPENGYYKIYVYNTAWWDVVCSYIWDANGTAREEWPGQDAYEDTYLLYPIMIPEEYAYVIFNNSDGEQTGDIGLISIDKSKTVYNNGTGEWMSIDDYDPNLEIEPPALPEPPDYSEYETKRVYLGNTLGWDSANFYVWSNDPEIGSLKAWPGTLMEFDNETGLYYADVPVCFDRIIFNNGSAQTLDLYMPALDDNKVVCDISKVVGSAGGGVDGSECWVAIEDFEIPDPILPPTYDVTVAVKNDAGWESVFIYYWGGDSTIEWPGTAMEAGPDGYYFAIIPAGTPYVLFHNGNVSEDGTPEIKTGDLIVPTDDNVLFNNADNQWHYYVIDGNQPDDPVVDPDDQPGGDNGDSDDTEEPAPEMNIFQKIWLAILEFFRRLFASFKK